jgi:hypothetical protein
MLERSVKIGEINLMVRYSSVCDDCPIIRGALKKAVVENFYNELRGNGMVKVECTDGEENETKKLIIRGSVNGNPFEMEHNLNTMECSPKPKKAARN